MIPGITNGRTSVRGRRHIVDPRVPRYSTCWHKQTNCPAVDEDRPRELTFPTHVLLRHLFRAGTICIRASKSALRSAAIKLAAFGALCGTAGRDGSRKNRGKTRKKKAKILSEIKSPPCLSHASRNGTRALLRRAGGEDDDVFQCSQP